MCVHFVFDRVPVQPPPILPHSATLKWQMGFKFQSAEYTRLWGHFSTFLMLENIVGHRKNLSPTVVLRSSCPQPAKQSWDVPHLVQTLRHSSADKRHGGWRWPFKVLLCRGRNLSGDWLTFCFTPPRLHHTKKQPAARSARGSVKQRTLTAVRWGCYSVKSEEALTGPTLECWMCHTDGWV